MIGCERGCVDVTDVSVERNEVNKGRENGSVRSPITLDDAHDTTCQLFLNGILVLSALPVEFFVLVLQRERFHRLGLHPIRRGRRFAVWLRN